MSNQFFAPINVHTEIVVNKEKLREVIQLQIKFLKKYNHGLAPELYKSIDILEELLE